VEVQPLGLDAGLRDGDKLLRVNGEPFRGFGPLNRLARLAEPGDSLQLDLERAEGQLRIQIPWDRLKRRSDLSPTDLALIVAVEILSPWFCILFGIFIVYQRPRDPTAWLLLAILLGFTQVFTQRGGDWEDAVRPLAVAGVEILGIGFPVGMLLLGVYYAYAVNPPWLRTAALGFAAFNVALQLVLAYLKVGLSENFNWIVALMPYRRQMEEASFWSGICCVTAFFALTTYKLVTSRAPDTRRRLRMLLYATYLSLTPSFLAIVFREFGGRSPQWLNMTGFITVALLPIALAYSILVHRVVDIGVAVRAGLQYALARGGVRLLQLIVATVGIAYAVQAMRGQEGHEGHMIGWTQHALILVLYTGAVLGIGWLSEPVFRWIDKRFFREAYSSDHVLEELAAKVRTVVDPSQLFEVIGNRVSAALHVPNIAFFLSQDGRFQPAYALNSGNPSAFEFPAASPVIKRLREQGAPLQLFLDDEDDWINQCPEVNHEERDRLKALRAQLLVPFEGPAGLVGFASLGPKRSEEPYTPIDMRLLRSVGLQAGLALENSRLAQSLADEAAQRERANREIEIAREVQQRLFPQTTPAVEGAEIAGICRPALAVGGDYYDYFATGDGGVGFAVGDVSGKGVGAAILMATLQASLRTQVLDTAEELATRVQRLNQVVYESSTRNRFATLFYAQYDPAAHRLRYVNAGHNRPVVIRADGQVERLALTGIAIGLKRRHQFSQREITLESGDWVIAFTDGISESMNPAFEEWGEEAMIQALLDLRHGPVEAMREGLLAAASDFAAGAVQHDDMTVVILHVC
jgi:sigma-B regulation protein RsbU (phosphoserine phosphatase)